MTSPIFILCLALLYIAAPNLFCSIDSSLIPLCITLGGTFFFPTFLLWGAEQAVQTALSFGLLLTSMRFCQRINVDEAGVACLMVLGGFVGFYNLGHRMTFTAIPVAAGFLGLQGFHAVHSIVLVFWHTFIVFVWAILLTIATLVSSHPFRRHAERDASSEARQSILSALSMYAQSIHSIIDVHSAESI